MARSKNTQFDIRGVHHVVLVCKDMVRTVEFYRDLLGMPLIKTIELPHGMGQHFFFDIGNGDSIAFFWFPEAPVAHPGVASPEALPGEGPFVTAHGSLNHLALHVPAEKFDEYVDRLVAKGVRVSQVMNHDDSPGQISATVTDAVFLRSVYFFDPDGVCIEFACWTAEPDEAEVNWQPATAGIA